MRRKHGLLFLLAPILVVLSRQLAPVAPRRRSTTPAIADRRSLHRRH